MVALGIGAFVVFGGSDGPSVEDRFTYGDDFSNNSSGWSGSTWISGSGYWQGGYRIDAGSSIYQRRAEPVPLQTGPAGPGARRRGRRGAGRSTVRDGGGVLPGDGPERRRRLLRVPGTGRRQGSADPKAGREGRLPGAGPRRRRPRGSRRARRTASRQPASRTARTSGCDCGSTARSPPRPPTPTGRWPTDRPAWSPCRRTAAAAATSGAVRQRRPVLDRIATAPAGRLGAAVGQLGFATVPTPNAQ